MSGVIQVAAGAGHHSNPDTATFASPVTAGNDIVVVIIADACTGFTVTDNKTGGSNTYTARVTKFQTTNACCAIYTAKGVAGGQALTITAARATGSGAYDITCGIAEVNGLLSTGDLDITGSGGATSTTASPVTTTGSGSTAQASELLVSVFSGDTTVSSSTITFTDTNGPTNYTTIANQTDGNTFIAGASGYIVLSAQETPNAKAAWSVNSGNVDSWAGVLATFKFASGGTSVNLTGSAITSSAGTVGRALAPSVTGSAITSGAGTVASAVAAVLAGSAITSAAGALLTALNTSLVGGAITSAAGTVVSSPAQALTGSGMAATPGTVGVGVAPLLTGASVATSAGAIAPASVVGLTGAGLAATPGTLTLAVGELLIGQSLTATPGTLTSEIDTGLIGQAVVSTTGQLGLSLGLPLVGASIVASPGVLLSGLEQALTGSPFAASAGTITAAIGALLAGQRVTASPGNVGVQAGGDVTIGLSGQAITLSPGHLAAALGIGLVGSGMAALPGTVTASEGGDVTVSLTGAVITLAGGQLVPGVVAFLQGAGIVGTPGIISAGTPGDVTVDLTGATVTLQTGIVGATVMQFTEQFLDGQDGRFASYNTRTQILAGPGGLVAGPSPGVAVGQFGWADIEAGTISNTMVDESQPIGLVLPVVGTWQKIYYDRGRWWLRTGLPVTAATNGEFFMRFPGGASQGDKVYANPIDGSAISGYAAGAIPTRWTVIRSAAPGQLAIISTWGVYPS